MFAARPAVAVINPDTGPGSTKRPGYRPLVRRLQRGGTTVLGYVTTSWQRRRLTELVAEARRHTDWYGVDGVFLDEVAVESSARRVRQLVDATGALAANPGRPVPPAWRKAAPHVRWVTFEGTAAAYLERGPAGAEPTDWHLVHSTPKAKRRAVEYLVAAQAPGLAFVTHDRLPNPWDTFPG